MVVAVRGVHEVGGDFLVHEFCCADMAPQPPLPVVPPGEDKYIALVSGLGLASAKVDNLQVRE